MPDGQGVQTPDKFVGTLPGSQAFPQPARPMSVLTAPMVCTGQEMHCVIPEAEEKNVAAHGEHTDEPGLAANLPGGQSVQVLRAPSANFPAGHA